MRRNIPLYVFAALFMAACATSGNKIDPEKMQGIREGTTTKAQVIELLGPPSISSLTGDGKEILSYAYTAVRPGVQNFIPLVGIVQSRTNLDQQIVQILLGPSGVVEKVTATDSSSSIKSGLITQ